MSNAAELKVPGQIESETARTDISAIAGYLQEHLGQKVTAYLSGLKDTKTVGQWVAGKSHPRDAAALRLRNAYQAARLIEDAFGDQTTKAWLFGINSHLGDEAPALVLRRGRSPEEVAPVVRAARAFAENGKQRTKLTSSADSNLTQLTQLLIREIELHREEPIDESTHKIASVIKEQVLGVTQRSDDRLRVLEIARKEIVEQLDGAVERLKNDLSGFLTENLEVPRTRPR